MDNVEFEKRLEQAFDNHLPIADKINQLRADLNDTKSSEYLIDSFFNKTLSQDLYNTFTLDEFYQLCQLHFKIANSAEFDDIETIPISNLELWQDSVTWLTVYFEFNIVLSQDNEKFAEFTESVILWYFKWVLAEIDENPNHSLKLIQKYHQLLAYYCKILELGERSIYQQRISQGVRVADKKLVEINLYEWLEAGDNDFDDCLACQYDDIIRAHCFLKRYDKALNWASEILDGSLSCGEVPHATNSLIAKAYFYTNQQDKALAILEKGYPLIKQKGEFIQPLAEFMRLYRAMGMTDKAIEIYQENKHLLEKCESKYQKMLMLIELMNLPIVEKLEYVQETISLATQFDLRNGNDYYLSQLPKSSHNI